MKFFHFLLLILLSKNFILSLNIVETTTLSDKGNFIVSNYFTHETFLNNTPDSDNPYESSIFFIIGESGIKTLYIYQSSINYLMSPENQCVIPHDEKIYSLSSDYIYIPKYLMFNDIMGKSSVFFAFCTGQYFFAVYYFTHNDGDYVTQNLEFKIAKGYDEFNLYNFTNKCSGSAYIGEKDFGDRVFVSNSYSSFIKEKNKWYINYEIKIFEYMVISPEINYFIGKSLNIELIDYTTTQQSNYDNSILNILDVLFNTTSNSLIKCKIINSYINFLLGSEFTYDKEIIIMCLYYTKDIINSKPNEPKLAIRLDLFKNNLGDNELNLISYINIKDSISLDKEDLEGINYLYPEMISYKDKEGEIYVILKGVKYTEIYIVNLDIEKLLLINSNLDLRKSYNNILVSFTQREFIGSFYFEELDKTNNKLNLYIYGDKNKNNYVQTKIELNNVLNVVNTQITSISNYLSAVLVDNKVIIIQFPICKPLDLEKNLFTEGTIPPLSYSEFVPIIDDGTYSNFFSYQNFIIDSLSRSNSLNLINLKIEFDENYLTTEEKDKYINIKYADDSRNLILEPKTHIEKLKVLYNLYYEPDGNKFYSPTCSILINICHQNCSTCSDYSTDDNDSKCKECLISSNYFPLSDSTTKCKNINDIPIQGYYFDKTEEKFMKCNTNSECEYCVGPNMDDCLKCNSNGLCLSETNLKFQIINNKTYEYSDCIEFNTNKYRYYFNYNFDDLSSKVCLDQTINECPESFPYYLTNKDVCFQNCKYSGTSEIYGDFKGKICLEKCTDFFIYENNTCVEECPEGYYLYKLKSYCIKKCDNTLYHVREEKEDINKGKYFELRCENTCPSSDEPYYFIDEEENKYCLPSCEKFDYYYGKDFEMKYDIYYKNTLVCFSKSQCNSFKDEYSSKKYVALINSTDSQKKLCVTECKEVSQYLLPPNYIEKESNKSLDVDCIPKCPEGLGNYSWNCIECASRYLYEYENNCIKECPSNSYKIVSYPYKCFSSCPEDFPYADDINYKCYKTLDEVPQSDTIKCDKTKYLWYKDYDVNNIPFDKCLNETDIYLTCDAVLREYPYTNKLSHECVKKCPDYMIQNENTKFCELNLNTDLDFSMIRDILLTHEFINTTSKNESNVLIYSRDANSEFTIIFYLSNYSSILEKVRNNINPEVTIQETNDDIRKDPSSPFYYSNGTEFIISDQCENLLRESYNIPYFTEYEYEDTIIEYINGIKTDHKETKKYYIPNYLLAITMDIKRDDTSQVEYKLYNPNPPYMELNLELCKENEDKKMNKVEINIEKKLNNETYNLFDEVYNYYINNIKENFEGKSSRDYTYDIFNKNSDFFKSPCTPFSSKYETDILSKDRYERFYKEINFCENNCTYISTERSFKNKEDNYVLIKCLCDLKNQFYKENEITFIPNFDGTGPIYDIDFQTIRSNFICFRKILNIKSIFSKENILGLISLLLFILILSLYIIQCMTSTSHLDETLKLIRLGKYDHGLNLFLSVKDYRIEKEKRDECYKRRKESKKVKLIKEKPKNMNVIQAKHKIKKAENNIKRKFEGKEMIPDEKKDELEIIRDRVKDLEEKLKLKYEKKGMKGKKIKIKIKEDPEDIKKIKQEIKLSKKRLEDLRRQKKEIELEKLKYHSFSSMASLPPNPPKRVLSEMPMLDEIDDDAIMASKEKLTNKINIKKNKKEKKKDNKSNKENKGKKEIKDNISKKPNEETKSKNENKKENIQNKDEILSINKNKQEENKNEEEKKEETNKIENEKEDKKEEEKKETESSWESYYSNDPEGKLKKIKVEFNKKNKEQKEKKNIEIQKLLVEKRIKEIERRIELLPEEAKKLRKLLEKEKRKKEMLEKGLSIQEIAKKEIEILNSENRLNTEEKEDENDLNINNEITKNEEIEEENLSDMEEQEEEESDSNEKISEKKTQNEITKIQKKKKDEFFKNILSKKYQFKYMRLFYEEYPYNFVREYAIINFNDLFTSDDFFYYYSDIEINEMIYRRALKEDRRSFCSMYWSFIKYKNNFIFCVTKDYFNFIIIKISILIYSLSIYPLLSCLFITDNLIHKIFIESNKIKKKTILKTNVVSIIQYIFTPIIIDILLFLIKKFFLIEKDIIDFIHKKKYHSNYILQEMVKGKDVRDEKDEEEKKKILLSIQNMNKNKDEKENEKDAFFEVNDKDLKKKKNIDYDKEFEDNKTLINEIRLEMSNYLEKVNNRINFLFLGFFLFSLFNFYYVTVFTMVYFNCYEKIIFGTLIPLGINFFYPFINCFVFVTFRYIALNSGFINLYKFSKILSYI